MSTKLRSDREGTTLPAIDDAVDPAQPGKELDSRPRRTIEGWRVRTWISEILRWGLLILLAILFMYPLLWLLSASFKPRGEVFDNALIPKTFTPGNYVDVWSELPLLSWLGNSIFIAVAGALLMTVASSAVAFGFAYFRFPGRNILFGLVLATMMLPGAVTLIPNYLIWKYIGFLGTNVPLWGSALFGSAFYIFLMRQFYMGIPRDLFEAARIDGCGYFALFRRIAFPLALPSAIIVFLFEFQASWNNFQGALIYLNFGDPDTYTVPLGINYAMSKYSPTAGGHGDYQYVMVTALVVTLPMLIMFAFGQKYFIKGISSGGVKG